MRKHVIRSIGIITKKENLVPSGSLSDCKNVILESADPFPGYHGTVIPSRNGPDAIYLVTRQAYNEDKMSRVIMKIRNAFPLAFDGAPGTITMSNKTVHVIRIKNLTYVHVPEIVEHFTASGIEFMKKKNIPEFNSLIKIRKFFEMKEAVEGIYQDVNERRFAYLRIPCLLRWSTFEKITLEIKYNTKDNRFDAAIGHVYEKDGLFDFVRIFDKNFRLGKLTYIREKYLDRIANL
jgi:hypothetical protein